MDAMIAMSVESSTTDAFMDAAEGMDSIPDCNVADMLRSAGVASAAQRAQIQRHLRQAKTGSGSGVPGPVPVDVRVT